MDQKKIGGFLKELRKQKGLTQEQFAEIVNVSNRTVSRWENGNNMPDLDVLIEISNYYQVDLREILDGERKSGKMDKAMEETVIKAVDYSYTETEHHNKRIHRLFLIGAIFWFVSQIISHTGLIEISYFRYASDFASGVACGMVIYGIIATSRFGWKIKASKQKLLKKIPLRREEGSR